jgi:hypothetical protein
VALLNIARTCRIIRTNPSNTSDQPGPSFVGSLSFCISSRILVCLLTFSSKVCRLCLAFCSRLNRLSFSYTKTSFIRMLGCNIYSYFLSNLFFAHFTTHSFILLIFALLFITCCLLEFVIIIV